MLLLIVAMALGVGFLAAVALAVRMKSQRDAAEQRVWQLLRRDSLTGLVTGDAWQEELQRELGRTERSGCAVCVAIADVETARPSSSGGRIPAGDDLLKRVAETWSRYIRPADMLSRAEGEFVILIPDSQMAPAAALMDRLRGHVPQELNCSASVAQWDGTESAQELVARARAALHSAGNPHSTVTSQPALRRISPHVGVWAKTQESQCTEPGCTGVATTQCAYKDRRGRECMETRCPEHHETVDDRGYCPHHAGIVTALAIMRGDPTSFPDLDNHAPSLVHWVGHDLDAAIQELLTKHQSSHLQVTTDGVTPHQEDNHRHRAWQRIWNLHSENGTSAIVSLVVAENCDSVITVRVDGDLIIEEVPPWITNKQQGVTPAAADDAQTRVDFYERITHLLHTGVERRMSLPQ